MADAYPEHDERLRQEPSFIAFRLVKPRPESLVSPLTP